MKPRKTPVTAEDRALFREAVGTVRPIRHDRVNRNPAAPRPTPRFSRADDREVLRDSLSDHYEPWQVESGDELLFVRPGIQHKLWQKLRRGHLSVGAELDLHGMVVPVARQAVTEFLHECRERGIRCVRIIHGKGLGSRHKAPVLKNKVNNWLRQRDEVLAFCTARPVDGGGGAIYVLLKSR